jgi:hypothetical protein
MTENQIRIWKKTAMTYLHIVPRYFPEATEEKHWKISRRIFGTATEIRIAFYRKEIWGVSATPFLDSAEEI